MTTFLPRDANDHVIPAMRLRDGAAHKITITSTSARNATAFQPDTKVISLYATGAVHVRFGNAAVSSTVADHYFPAGVYYDVAIGGGDVAQYSHIAAIRADTDCVLYVSEKI